VTFAVPDPAAQQQARRGLAAKRFGATSVPAAPTPEVHDLRGDTAGS
jgi:hypothetical protein